MELEYVPSSEELGPIPEVACWPPAAGFDGIAMFSISPIVTMTLA